MNKKMKRFIVDNRSSIESSVVALAVAGAGAAAAAFNTIVLNTHEYKMQRVVTSKLSKKRGRGVVVYEDMTWAAEMRDSLHPNNYSIESEYFSDYFDGETV